MSQLGMKNLVLKYVCVCVCGLSFEGCTVCTEGLCVCEHERQIVYANIKLKKKRKKKLPETLST